MNVKKAVTLVSLPLSSYRKTLKFQRKLFQARQQDKIEDTLITVRHNPTITMGKSTDKNNLLATAQNLKEWGIDFVQVERGGGITYHGPGQVVLYPIFDLRNWGKDLHLFVNKLQRSLARTTTTYGIKTEIRTSYPGLWIKNKQEKIGSLGLQLRKWVTMHGLALNVNLNEQYCRLINPCGMKNVKLVSISDFSSDWNIAETQRRLLDHFSEIFEVALEEKEHERLPSMG